MADAMAAAMAVATISVRLVAMSVAMAFAMPTILATGELPTMGGTSHMLYGWLSESYSLCNRCVLTIGAFSSNNAMMIYVSPTIQY